MQATRYLIALRPAKANALFYTQVANKLFSAMTDGYLLKEEASYPHITLASFHCEDGQSLNDICKAISHWAIDGCEVRMIGMLFKKAKIPPNHYSVSLAIARDPPILHLHHLSLKLLKSLDLYPLNLKEDLYLPHLTLAGISWPSTQIVQLSSLVDDLITMSLKPFSLALARGDKMGQYLETLSEF